MSGELLLAKLLSLYIYDAFQKEISYEEILSLTKPISEESYDLVIKSVDWLNSVDSMVTIIDDYSDSKSIYSQTIKWSKNFGSVNKYKKNDRDVWDYVPNDPHQYLIVVIDHIKLLHVSKQSLREEIELCSNYLITLRKKLNLCVTIVQQVNRNSKSMDRKLNGYEMLALDDLSDSSATAQAAEQVIGIFYPHREKIKKCQNYNVEELESNFRILQVLKNRFGKSDVSIGTGFYGEIGYWKELPKAENINYSDYKNLTKKTDDENEKDKKINFKFN